MNMTISSKIFKSSLSGTVDLTSIDGWILDNTRDSEEFEVKVTVTLFDQTEGKKEQVIS